MALPDIELPALLETPKVETHKEWVLFYVIKCFLIRHKASFQPVMQRILSCTNEWSLQLSWKSMPPSKIK